MIIFCLPLYLIRLKIFGIPTNVLELMIYGLFVLWLINKGYKGLWSILKHERLLIWGIVLLLIGAGLATAFSWDLKVSAGILKGWFIDVVVFFLVIVSVIKKDDVKNVFNALIYSGLVVSIISLVYLIQGNFNYQGRLQGIYNSPNFLAMYLAPCLLIAIIFLFIKIQSHKGTRQRPSEALRSVSASPLTMLGLREIFLVIEFLTILVVLFFTKSFGVLLGIVVALVFGTAIYLYRQNKKKLVLLLIVFVFVAIFVLGIIKIQSSEGLKSFDARFVIWETAIDAFLARPITGIGPGTFQDYFPPYPKWGVPQPHNIFLAFLIQTGIVGFIGFICLLLGVFRNGFKLLKTQYSLLIMVLMAYILIHGLVDTTYWKNDLAIMFWIITGLMLVIKKEP